MPIHTDKHYEKELRELKDLILKMGGIVEEMIAKSVKSLVDRNFDLSRDVVKKDPDVNNLEMEIDEACVNLLALRQPAASDLRFITIGLRISKDLERMGDLAVNIAENAIEINQEPLLKSYVDLPKMATDAQKMVKNSLDAFVQRDVAAAKLVCAVDDVVDEKNREIFNELTELMQKEPATVLRGTRLIAIANHLERIADHATNIAEEVIYMVQGKDIRHGQVV